MFRPAHVTNKVLPYNMKKMYRKNILSDIYMNRENEYKYIINKKYHLLIVIPKYLKFECEGFLY